MTTHAWPSRPLTPTDIPVGPCAWRMSACTETHEPYLREHPSLMVAAADDDPETLQNAAPVLARLRHANPGQTPVLLGVHEPPFVRHLKDSIESRLRALALDRVDVIMLWVQEIEDLKSGGAMQALFDLRDRGITRYVGLAHHDARAIEWLAIHTAVHVLAMPYHTHNQLARYRALGTAREYGMACLALQQPNPDATAIRFALAETGRATAVLEPPLPDPPAPMTADALDKTWADYRQLHREPAPLPRGKPPQTTPDKRP